MTNDVCQHGGLRRKCPICERDDEIVLLQQDIDALRAAAKDMVTCVLHGELATGLTHEECVSRLHEMSVTEHTPDPPNPGADRRA